MDFHGGVYSSLGSGELRRLSGNTRLASARNLLSSFRRAHRGSLEKKRPGHCRSDHLSSHRFSIRGFATARKDVR